MLTHGSVVIPAETLEGEYGGSAVFDGKLVFVCFGESICKRLDGVGGRLVASARLGQLRVLLPEDVEAVQHGGRGYRFKRRLDLVSVEAGSRFSFE